MAFVSLLRPDKLMSKLGGNHHKGKTAQTSTNENDSVHASPVILQTYASRSTVSKCPENNSHSARCLTEHSTFAGNGAMLISASDVIAFA